MRKHCNKQVPPPLTEMDQNYPAVLQVLQLQEITGDFHPSDLQGRELSSSHCSDVLGNGFSEGQLKAAFGCLTISVFILTLLQLFSSFNSAFNSNPNFLITLPHFSV